VEAKKAWLTWFILALFYSFQFFLRSSPNALAIPLMDEFHMDAGTLGVFASSYYITYSFFQIPVGIALDTYGPKTVLRAGTAFCVMGAILFSFASTLPMALLGRALIGMGGAVSFIGSIHMTTLWFSPLQLTFAVGLLSSVGKLAGGALANAWLPTFIDLAPSWHHVMWGLCAWGSFLSLLIWVFVKNGPSDFFHSSLKGQSFGYYKKEFFTVMRSAVVWRMGIFGYALYLSLSVFSDTYSMGFLQQLFGISKSSAGKLASLVMIGSAFGAAVLSYLSGRFKKRRMFLRLSGGLTAFFGGLIFFCPMHSVALCGFFLFCLGFFSGGQVLIFIISSENLPARLSGMAVGATNAIMMLGGTFHNPLVGEILKFFWDGQKEGAHPVYTLLDYRVAFSSIFIFYLFSFLIAIRMPESSFKSPSV
jgi:MFS family permease